jgi:hypothetical protein
MPVRPRPAARRHQHIDQAIAPGGILSAEQDRIAAADDGHMPQRRIVRLDDREFPVRIVGRYR